MFDPQAAKARCEAAAKARPLEGVAALWVRRYREDLPAALEALEEAQGKLETLQAHHALHCGCGKPLDRILKGENNG